VGELGVKQRTMENQDIQLPTLHTERLHLEPINISHSMGMFELWSHPKVCEYSGPAVDLEGDQIQLPALTPADSDKIIHYFVKYQHSLEKVRWAMISKVNSSFVGAVGFNSLNRCPELAYHLHPNFWGKGLMSEGCSTIIAWASTSLEPYSIEAFVDPANIPSINLLKRLKFNPTGKIREGCEHYVLSVPIA